MAKQHSSIEVFLAFFRLGLTSFGGPIAHIAYFRETFVNQRQWLTEIQFAQLLALCQFLPGPASSQMGFSLGLMRAGWLGAISAFIAFTLPSALLLFLLASVLPHLTGDIATAAIHGLKLVALPIVAQAVWQMSKQLTPDWPRRCIALLAVIILLSLEHVLLQIFVICLGSLAGLIFCRQNKQIDYELMISYSHKTAWMLLTLFLCLLFLLPLFSHQNQLVSTASAFYHAGALVFGGGHVVLPLLENAVVVPGWITTDDYLVGYGAAQTVPGPMFSIAAYLGALLPGTSGGLLGASIALIAIFLPGFLLLTAMLPIWHSVTQYKSTASLVAGANAAVVGLLAAALYDPIWTSVIYSPVDILIALSGFVLLQFYKLSALLIVFWCLLSSMVISLI